MVRLALAIALISGVVTRTEAEPTKAKQAKASKSKSKSKSKRQERRKTFSRAITVSKRVYDGLPPGFSWPPNRAMDDAGKACEAKLTGMGVKWEHVKRVGRVANPIIISDGMLGKIKYTNMFGAKASSTMECQLGVALATIGPELYGLGVREVKYGSIYDLSYIKGIRGRELSRHAIAVAMDIGSFVDNTGRDVKVTTSYNEGDNLLLAIEELFIASSDFHNIITPKNDPISHYNHFHVEAVVDFRAPSRPALSML
ncbi:MAG: extensin family protein [Kofleriaceae bacterium]